MPEQQNIEYKSSWHDDYLKWICGFANAQGGRIYIGKNDGGKIVGVDDCKTLMDEMLLNALIHRNYMGAPTQLRVYDNKLTLWSHGTLPEGITLDKLTKSHSSFPRNPVLAEACFRGGYIDSWGSGIMKIVDSCNMAGLPTPVIEEDCGGLMVRLFKDRFSEEELQNLGLNARQIRSVLYVKEKGRITNGEYQEINSISRRWATEELADLVNNNVFKNIGYGAGSYYELIAH